MFLSQVRKEVVCMEVKKSSVLRSQTVTEPRGHLGQGLNISLSVRTSIVDHHKNSICIYTRYTHLVMLVGALLHQSELPCTLETGMLLLLLRPLHNFRMIERHYFRNQLIRSYDFSLPFVIPGTKNTWEVALRAACLLVRMPFEERWIARTLFRSCLARPRTPCTERRAQRDREGEEQQKKIKRRGREGTEF